MNIDEFWTIVNRVHAASPSDMEIKCTLLAKELRCLLPDEIKSFDAHFTDCFFRSYTYDVWGAAFVMCDGCSDDSFMDFRATLISLGRKPFETALSDADSLDQFEIDPDWAQYEGYQYVGSKVYRELSGKEVDCDCAECRRNNSMPVKVHPKKPAGIRFVEWEMSLRFPKLAAKYGYQDSKWLYLKKQKNKTDKKLQASRQAVDLLLKAGIVSSCGLIPPFRIVTKVLKSGQSPQSAGFDCKWAPFDLDEGNYWSAVMLLEGMQPEELTSRPELKKVKLRLDLECSGIDDFDEWMAGLQKRGLI